MKHLIRLLIIIGSVTFGMCQVACAEKIKAEYSYFEDKFNEVGKDDLPFIDFVDSDNTINKPFGKHTHWVKIKIKDKSKSDLVLRVKPTYLDKVEFYQQKNTAVNLIKTYGDTRIGSLVESNDIAYRFEIEEDDSIDTYYLKINTTSNVYLYAEILSNDDADNKKSIESIYIGIYVGVSFIFMMLSAVLLSQNKSLITILLAIGILSSTTSSLLRSGTIDFITKQTFIPSSQFTTAMTGISIVFFILFLNEYIRIHLNKIFIYKITTSLTAILCAFIGYKYISTGAIDTQTFMYLAIINYTLAIYVYFKFVIWMKSYAIKIISTLLVTLGLYNVALNLGILGSLADDTYIFLGRNIFFYAFFSFMILIFIKDESLKKKNLVAANQSKDLITNKEKNRRFELEKEIGILLHEIKTPLSIIQLSIDNLKNNYNNSDPSIFKRFKNISDSAEQINSIIIRSLMLEKDNHSKELETSKIKLVDLISKVTSKLESKRFNITCDSNLYVLTNEFTFEIIMKNLIDNAYKHSEPNTTITIKAQPAEDNFTKQVEIIIENFLNIHHKEIALSKFQSSLEMQSGKNMGLGLWLINELCKTLGIRIFNQVDQNLVQFKLLVSA